MTEAEHTCTVCASRGRQTRLTTGHCCAICTQRITDNLTAIPELAAMAAAALIPGSGTTGSTTAAYGSKPPINLDAVDPALAHVPGHDAPLLVLLEDWERMIREMRGMVPYGLASAARSNAAARTMQATTDHTSATLTGVCGFLRASVDWATTRPDFPIDDFATEIAECVRAVRRWDTNRDDIGTMVRCPTLTDTTDDDGHARSCGYRLYYASVHDDVTCRRCGTTRSAMTLAAVAMADGREVWLDPEAAAQYLGVTEGTLRQWARSGRIARDHGRYLIQTERMLA